MTRILDDGPRLRSIVTRQSLLPRLAQRNERSWSEDWQLLFTRYAPAIAGYVRSILRRSLKRPPKDEDVEDLVQAYFATCMEKDWLGAELASIRCFRAWLQTQVKRFVHNELTHRFAQKRNPGATAPEAVLEGVAGDTTAPEATLDAAWLAVALDAAEARLRAANEDYAEVIADLRRTDGEGSPDLAARMGKSSQQIVHLRHRARRRFGILVYEELQQGVTDPEAFEALCDRLGPYLP